MGSTELTVMRLLTALEACRQTLDERVRSLRVQDHGLSRQCNSTIRVESGAVDRIAAYATVVVAHPTLRDDSSLELGLLNQVSLLIGVEVAPAGFQVTSSLYVTFDWRMGTTSRGSHTLHEHRSGMLTGEQAEGEARAQAAILAGLDAYQHTLGFLNP